MHKHARTHAASDPLPACLTPCSYLKQATTPLVVFMVGCGFGTEKFTLGSLGNMFIVGVGIAIASYGALPGMGCLASGVAD